MNSWVLIFLSFLFLVADNAAQSMDYVRKYFVSNAKKSTSTAPQEPYATVEASYTLEFGDNAYAMYEFDGRDNKLICCWLDELYAPLYVEYPGDEKKSYGIKNLIDRNGIAPSYSFDDSDSWKKIPGSDLKVYRFWGWEDTKLLNNNQMDKVTLSAHMKGEKSSQLISLYQALRCEYDKIVWRSPLIQLSKLLVMHTTLPYFASCEEKEIKGYSTSMFTTPENGIREPLFVIPVKEGLSQWLCRIMWHPTENKLLLKADDNTVSEFNGDSKKIERIFHTKTVWIWPNNRYTYVPYTKQIIAIGSPSGQMSRLYELRENEEPYELPISLVGHSEKTVVYNKIIDVVRNYLIVECMFSNNPRFLGVCNLLTNKLYNVHNFGTEEGSIVFDPHTLKMFEIGHRIYYTYPSVPAVYNRECSILKLELPSLVGSSDV